MVDLDLVDRFYLSMNGDNWDDFIVLCDPQIEWIQNEGFPYGGHHCGSNAVIKDVYLKLRMSWNDFSFSREETHIAGDVVTVLGRYKGTNPETRKSFRAAAAHILEFKNGRVSRFRQYTDTAMITAKLPR